MRFLMACLLILITPLLAAGQGYTLVDHPRILVNKARLPELARRAYAGGMLGEDYAPLKGEADRIVAEETCHALDDVWHRPMDMLAACLVYLVERERGNDSAYVYARAVKHVWQKWDAAHPLYGTGAVLSNVGPGHFGSFAIAYDWIYDYLTPEERKAYGDKLGGWLVYYTGQSQITLKDGDWLYNQTWGPEHLNTPNCRDGITPKLLVALALAGAGTAWEADTKQYLDSWYSRIPSECMPLFDMMGGVWSESMGHGLYANVQTTPWAFEAWRTATGQDWFQLGEPTTFLKDLNRWAVFLTVPFNNRTAYIDDNAFPETLPSTLKNVAPILGARYRDPVANWIASNWQRGRWPDEWFSSNTIFRFVPYDENVTPVSPGQSGWELSHLFEGAGHVYMRSQWDNPDATWAFFGAGPFYAAHSRDDEGHFLIAKKGWLVMRAGGTGHNDDDYYAGGSMPFNIVTVYDSKEQFRRTTLESSGVVINPNDGGLIRRVYTGRTEKGGQRQERGHITAYSHNLRYTYAAADLRDGYSKSKLNEITRQFLYLRGEHEFFVIFDRVESTSADYPKTWFLHLPTQPTLDGAESVEVANHVLHYSGAKVSTWLSDPCRTDQAVLSSGRSRAFLSTLLPANAAITVRGGTGYDYWGNPHNTAGRKNFTGSSTANPPQVPWRLEVEPPAAATRDLFLNVLEVADEGQTTPAPVELLQNDGQTVVFRITPSSGQPVEVRFNSQGETGGTLRFGDSQEETLPVSAETSGQTGFRHDVNRDGRVGMADALALILRVMSGDSDQGFDFNGDGRVGLADVVALVRFLGQAGAPGSGPYLAGK